MIRPFFRGRDRLAFAQLHLVARALLLALLATLAARLLWVLLTPVGPVGDWQLSQPRVQSPAVRAAIRNAAPPTADRQETIAVTSLDLELFGIRENRGTGGGGAIIGLPDGEQQAYGIGDEIVPGARLAGVAFDHVLIDRGGITERLYLDQSEPAPVATAGNSAPDAPRVVPGESEAARMIASAVQFSARREGSNITGIRVTPGTQRALWQQSGLQTGDVIVGVNGADITSERDLRELQSSLRPGARLSVIVERGSKRVPLNINF